VLEKNLMKHQVVLIEGDGIGPEICSAVRQIIDASGVEIDWVPVGAGLGEIEAHGKAITKEGLDTISRVGIALKGPTTTPVGGGHSSVNVQMRKELGLFANVRMVRSLPGVPTRYSDVNLVVVRENVEDTYGGIEYMQTPDVALGFKFITRQGSEAICRYAFEYARAMGRRMVTCVHKANIHKMSDGLFLRVFREVAADYPDLDANDLIVDNACMQLVTRPESYDVLVMPNLFGDIVSDLCAGLIGGLGVAPGANIGNDLAIFEAVHGSAPDIAGRGIANPSALLQSGIHMLRYIGESDAADRIENALHATLEAGDKTGDLGGNLNTEGFTSALVSRLRPASAEQTVVASRISLAPSAAATRATTQLVGFDLYVQSTAYPDAPEALGAFKLVGCANRGTNVTREQESRAQLVDWWRLRYTAEAPVTDEDLALALREIPGSVSWMHIEKLQLFDGVPAFV